jgi:hypothetical protein
MIFMSEYHLYLKHNISIPLLRQNDRLIMESLVQLNIPIMELKACNQCRLFLKNCNLSEIVTGDGTYISDEAWLGYLPVTQHKNGWPNHPKLPRASWAIWQKWLYKAFVTRGRRLRQTLGAWIKWEENWPWYLTSEGNLYRLQDNIWYSHSPVLRRNRLSMFKADGIECPAPIKPLRATVYKKRLQNSMYMQRGDR